MGSVQWATVTAWAFNILLTQEACAEVAKPEWWSDEGLKALSASVVRAAPNDIEAHRMRAMVVHGQSSAWEAGPRSVAELRGRRPRTTSGRLYPDDLITLFDFPCRLGRPTVTDHLDTKSRLPVTSALLPLYRFSSAAFVFSGVFKACGCLFRSK